ncbi:MAG: DUF4388 domain-containing protein [Planctomycetota bacterium]|jgi:tetratricopeptide (TPR) repeat protein
MPIKGDLSRIDLANIFQMLTLNQNEGTLNIYYASVHKSLYFTGSDIMMPFDRDAMEDRVLSLLLRQGKLTDESIERARYNTSTLNTGLLGAIIQMRFASEEDVHAAYINQMEEDTYELFLLKDAHFEFLEGEQPMGNKTMDSRFLLSPNNLLMEAVRRGDEWAHIRELVPSEVEVFEILDPTLPEGVEDVNGEFSLILSFMDGVRSIKRIIEETRLHRFTVCKNCSILVDAGKVVPVDSALLIQRGDECIEASRTFDAIDLYERAIAAGMDDYLVFEKTGYAYKYISEYKKAINHFYRYCEQCESRGALKQAIKTYQLIRELVPTEIVARERIFQLFLNNAELFADDEYDPVGEGTQLALIFKELGRAQDALDVVNLLFDACSENNEILEELAKLALDIQSSATALQILEHLGDRLLGERDSTNALRIFRRIKCIDPEFRGIDDKLDRLMEVDLVRRKKRVRFVKNLILVGSFMGLFLAYFLFNSYAFDAYTKINLESLLSTNSFDEARRTYKNFCAKFPLSIYWFLAREKINTIDVAERRYLDAENLRADYEAEERLNSQRNAENLYVDAMASLKASDLATGLRLLKKVAAAATDRAWLEENEVNEMVESLQRYFEEASELKTEADKLREAGKFAEAHDLLTQLVSRYGQTKDATLARFPILIKSSPSGARIKVNGKEVYTGEGNRVTVTPAVLDVEPSRNLEIQVEKDGFMHERRVVDAFVSQELSFELRFRPEKGIEVGSNVAFMPYVSDSSAVLGYRDGRIKRYSFEKSDFLWSYTVKDLQNLDSPPGVSATHVYFCWGDGRLSALELETGKVTWEKSLPARSRLAPLEWLGVLFVPMDNGRVLLLNPEDGKTILDKELKSRALLNPIPWEQGAILALEDGRVVWLETTKGRSVQQRRLLGKPTVLHRDEDDLVIGNEKGGLDCFNIQTAEVLYSYAYKKEKPVTQLMTKGDLVYGVLGEKRLFALDKGRLQLTGEFMMPSVRLWLGTGGSATITVGGSDSVMYLLRASDLSVIRKYRAEGEIVFPGIDLNECVYFYSKDGILNGIRY